MTRMTGSEQARFVPPTCPKCGSSDVEVNWLDDTYQGDDERRFTVGSFDCRTCHGRGIAP